MVFALLTRHWLARRHYPFASWAACIVRSLRVLLFRRAHAQLLAMDVYRHYVTPAHDDVFHHLSHRNHLARGLSLRQRVRCVLTHYRFEDATFDAAYKQAVYRDGGLVLWQHEADGTKVEVRLVMAQRLNAEGDLTLTLMANGRRAYPANSPPVSTPGVFCCAALQGIAQALGMGHAVTVKSAWHCAYAPSGDKQFALAYDHFWRSLGGTGMPGRAWHIPCRSRPDR